MKEQAMDQRQSAYTVRGPRGFTLVELLVASSILVVALLGIASVLPTADVTLHQAGQISKAVSLAQQMIETIKNDPFTELTRYHGVDTRNTATYPTDEPIPPLPGTAGNFMGGTNVTRWKDDINLYLTSGVGITGGYGTIVVSTVASDGSGNAVLRKVTVEVGWRERGQDFRVQLATLASAI
jgi:prepilin-type N-terminal cleavage/methylation domain-containing protein